MFEIRELPYRELEQCQGFAEVVAEYQEATTNPAIGAPSVQFDRYRELDALGTLKCLGAFADNALVGLSSVLFARSQHYGFPIASIDSFYLRKDYRTGTNGLRLIRAVKALVKNEGAPGVVFMAPPDTNYEKVCQRLGMVHTHSAYWWKV